MQTQKLRFRLSAYVILPFRSTIRPFAVSAMLPGDSHATSFVLSYPESISLAAGANLDAKAWTFDVKAWTAVKVETEVSLPENAIQDATWFYNNGQGNFILREEFLPRINAFFLRLKNVRPEAFHTGVLRSVGDVDVVFYAISYQGTVRCSRGTSTMFRFPSADEDSFDAAKVDFSAAVPQEWAVLTRAVDLVNHGYHLEGFVAGFALLDVLVQDFARRKLQERGLDEEESSQFLRKIESERLKTYLGSILRIAGGKSPLNDPDLRRDLDWINTKRNKVMHGGVSCSHEDASRGLRIVVAIIRALNDCGAAYSVPTRLEFW